jgi:hypothetical protein
MNQKNDSTPQRYPNLGKLSIAILEEYVKKVIGESAIEELKSPVKEKELSDALEKALERTESRFIYEHDDKEITQEIVQLPIHDLPKFRQAIWSFAEHPGDPAFRNLLHSQLKTDYSSVPDERIQAAVDAYLAILRQELASVSSDIRMKLMAISLFDIDEQMKEFVKRLLEFLEYWKRQNQEKRTHRGVVPPMPQIVVGREKDLEELKVKLGLRDEREKATAVLTAIRGWPGVGKTTIASVLAHDPEIARAFPDGVLWTSLGQEPNLLSEMAAWGRALGTDELLRARSIQEAQAQLAALLRNKRMLLLIDDVWETAHAVPFNVGGPGCATLITTRLNDVARALTTFPENIYLLPVLSDESAMELMRILAPKVVEQHPDDMLELVHDLEGLPLALQVAGRLLQSEASIGFGVRDLISELRESARLLDEDAPPDRVDLVNETTPKIAALLQKSTNILDDYTRDCYAYLGVFAPKPATFDQEAMAYVWEVDDPKPIIRKLVDHGLLEYVFELNRFQMHALLVMQAKSLLTDE